MMYPFLTLDDGTEIVHSEMKDDGRVKVYIEKPDAADCFHHATCWLPDYTWEDVFGFTGEATFYLTTDFWFPEEGERWLVIGNNDAFKLWLNGELVRENQEVRNWQPHCHGDIVRLKQGRNRISLKLTKRSKTLEFSLGIRRYEGNHYHRMPWETEYASIKMPEEKG